MSAAAGSRHSDALRLYYRPREVAEMTGLSLRTVRRRVESGAWRSKLDGGCRLIYAEDVDDVPRAIRPDLGAPDREADAWARDFMQRRRV